MRKQILKRVLGFSRPYIGYLVLALISAVLSVGMTLYAPILIGRGIDQIIGPGNVDFKAILADIAWLAGTVAVGALFQWLLAQCTNILAYRTVRDLRVSVFDKLERVPLKYIDSNAHGDLISRVVNDIDQVSDGLLQGFTQLFTGVVTILGTLGFMLSVSPWIALVVVVLTPLSLFVSAFIAKRSYQKFREQSETRGELSGYAEELVGGQRIVKAFGYEQRAQETFEEINARLYDCGVKAQFYSSLTNPCTRFVNAMVYAAVGVCGAIAALRGGLTIGQLSAFLQYANQYTKPFNEISGVVTELQTAIACAGRVFEVLDSPDETPDPADAVVMAESKGQVNLHDVSFSYHPGKRFIEALNLYANPGQRIAIVGPTGCGKTTIINLLMRFYDVDAGEILVDDVDIRHITRASLRGQFGMVLQDTWLFAGTVRENIAYGRPDATQEQVAAAAKAAHAHSFIKRLAQGYDTVLAEDGGNLSQGQRQLLSIARVMLTDPPMLILDEATSSIDTRTEIYVQRAFTRMMEGRTCFIVAHRLSTIREADCILVMRDGKIIEQGTHESLLRKEGYYAQLYNSQFARSEG